MSKLIAGIKIYTFGEVLELLEVSRPVLRNYIQDGRIRARRIGKGWFITETAIQEWLNGEKIESEIAHRHVNKKINY